MNPLDPPQDLPEHPTLSYKGPRSIATLAPPPDGPATLAPAGAEAATFAGTVGVAPTELAEPKQPPYRLLRKVAAGGMGEVWEAVQTSLGRVVAIKVIRPDRLRGDQREVDLLSEEFRREAVFAARLEHPNIIPVHDLGRDESGAPLLAMKYVQGTPWDKELARDLRSLSAAQLIGKHAPILIAVAQAVAFAHSKGVVHRDLKPAQVMLGGFGEVLLIDWGLAVFTGDESLLEETRRLGLPELEGSLTASNPSGTPALMAPEQTERTAKRIGPWTDIYLLGGTLYFILTGTFPHEDSSAHRAFLRARTGEVEPPSRRAPDREVPADLERLCLHALRPEPMDRCPSAAEFIAALQDHISGETRRRESRELAAKARAELASGARDYSRLAACAALLEQAHALWQANPDLPAIREEVFSTHAALALRNDDLVLARVQAERLDRGAARERLLGEVGAGERASLRRQRTRRVAIGSALWLLTVTVLGGAFFTHQLSRSRDAEAGQRAAAEAQRDLAREARGKSDEFARFVLEDMTKRLAELNRLELLDPAVERALGYYTSVPFAELPVEEWKAPIEGLIAVMNASRTRGNPETQEVASRTLGGLFDALPADVAAEVGWRKRRAGFLLQRGLFQSSRGDLPAATATMRACADLYEDVVRDEPSDGDVLDNYAEVLGEWARLLNEAGDHAAAIATAKRSVAASEEAIRAAGASQLREGHLLSLLHRQLLYMTRIPDPAEGAELAERVRARAQEVAALGEPYAISAAAAAFNTTAAWERASGTTARGVEDAMASVALYRRANELRPADVANMRNLADTLSLLAILQGQAGDRPGAAESYASALAVADQLLARDPGNVESLAVIGGILNNSVNLALALGRIDEARAFSERQRAIADTFMSVAPERVGAARSVALAAVRIVAVHRAASEFALGVEAGERAVRIADEVAARFPEDKELRQNRIVARSWHAGLLGLADRRDEAIEVQGAICEAAEEALAAEPNSRAALETLGSVCINYATSLRGVGRVREAADVGARAVETQRALLALDPSRVVAASSLARALADQGSLLDSIGDRESALAALREAMEVAKSVEARDPTAFRIAESIASAGAAATRILAGAGRETEAREVLETSLAAADRQRSRLSADSQDDRHSVDTVVLRVAYAADALADARLALDLAAQIHESRALDTQPSVSDRILESQLAILDSRGFQHFGRIADSRANAEDSLRIASELSAAEPFSDFHKIEVVVALQCLSTLAAEAGDPERALALIEQAESTMRSLSPSELAAPSTASRFATVLRAKAGVLSGLDRHDEAIAALDASLDALAPGIEAGLDGAVRGRVEGLLAKAQALSKLARLDEASALIDEAAALRPWRDEPEERRLLLDRALRHAELDLAQATGDPERTRAALEAMLAAFQPRQGRNDNIAAKATRAVLLLRLGREAEAAPLAEEVRATEFRGGRFFDPLFE